MVSQEAELERLRKEIFDLRQESASEEEMLDSMFEVSPVAIAVMRGPQFIFEKVNKKWATLLSERAHIGRTVKDVYPELGLGPLIEHLTNVYTSGIRYEAKEFKIELTSDQGTEDLYYDLTYERSKNAGVKGYAVYSYAQDVTERVQARKKLEATKVQLETEVFHADRERSKFQAAFQTIDEGVFIFDSNGNPVYMNEGAAKVFGAQSAQDVTQRFEFYFERLDLYELDDSFIELSEWPVSKALRGEDFKDWQIKAHRTDINEKWIWSSSGSLVTQKGSELTLAVVVLRNITKQKAAENELRSAKSEAENANLAKTAFIAHMSHEIRTPLGVILGFCELLLSEVTSEAQRLNYLDRVVKNAKGLTQIIDDILDIAKVESGKMEIAEIEFSLPELLNEVIDLFSDRVKDKRIALSLHTQEGLPRSIWSDPTRLRQILINIVGNAVKFTNSGGIDVTVKVRALEEDRCEFEIKVSDSGIGLSPSMQKLLFQPFVQGNSNINRNFGGTGLGLVISRRLAMALGGNIEIGDSLEGKGSTFVISFKAGVKATSTLSNALKQEALPKVPASSAVEGKPLANFSILLAEDSLDNQLLVKRILIKNGATVALANDGQEAIDIALAESFDVILMDVQMPKVDGYQAARTLREGGFTAPIIALTAHAMVEEKAKSREAGCSAHLTKPIDTKELVKTIRDLVGVKAIP